jgi:protein tyrosine/serine phosphatase
MKQILLSLLAILFLSSNLMAEEATCSSSFNSFSDLLANDITSKTLMDKFSTQMDKIKKDGSYTYKYKQDSTHYVIFRGMAHAATWNPNNAASAALKPLPTEQPLVEPSSSAQAGPASTEGKTSSDKTTASNQIDLVTYNDNLIASIDKLIKKYKIKTIIIERNDQEIPTLKTNVQKSYPDKTAIEQAKNEVDVAVWGAIQNKIDLKGGEPLSKDFSDIIKKISTYTGFNTDDYFYGEFYRCIGTMQNTSEQGIDKDSWASVSESCWNSASKYCYDKPAKSTYKDGISVFQDWFKIRGKNYPTAYRMKNIPTDDQGYNNCIKAKTDTDIAVMYASKCFIFATSPDNFAYQSTVSYIFTIDELIKNYCLTKGIVSNLKKGSVLVIYGAGHMMETYKNLTGQVCEKNNFNCPEELKE